MKRRSLLAASVGGGVGLAGCIDRFEVGGDDPTGDSSDGDGGDGGETGPSDEVRNELRSAVERFVAALDEGDDESMAAVTTDDVPVEELTNLPAAEELDVGLDAISVTDVDEDAGTATVRAEIVHRGEAGDDGSFSWIVDLRAVDGEWLVSDVTDTGTNRSANPAATFDIDQETDGSNLTGVTVRFTSIDRLDVVAFEGCGTYEESFDTPAVGNSIALDVGALAESCGDERMINVIGKYDGRESVLRTFELDGEPQP